MSSFWQLVGAYATLPEHRMCWSNPQRWKSSCIRPKSRGKSGHFYLVKPASRTLNNILDFLIPLVYLLTNPLRQPLALLKVPYSSALFLDWSKHFWTFLMLLLRSRLAAEQFLAAQPVLVCGVHPMPSACQQATGVGPSLCAKKWPVLTPEPLTMVPSMEKRLTPLELWCSSIAIQTLWWR